AIHLLDRVPGARRRTARHRYSLQLAARAAGVSGRHRTDDPESLPDRHVDPDRRLSRAVLHVPRPGAGGDRLAVPADPVPQASGIACAGCSRGKLTRQAARTDSRNLATSILRRLLSPDSNCAAERTCDEAVSVSVAPRCTSVMLAETICVPCAACCTLREISCVAAPCSSTAAAIAEEISESFPMVPEISWMAPTESWVAAWIPVICCPISPVALAVCSASAFTSDATTAKPRPASPARAASMLALSASRLVCPAMVLISSTTSPMRVAASDNALTRSSVFCACSTASPAILAD